MKFILPCLLLLGSQAHAALCHTTPTSDDRAFYDKAAISTAVQLTWGGLAANQYAASLVYQRRIAFYGADYALAGGAYDAEESALWDALVLAAIEKGSYNTSGVTPWVQYYPASVWSHVIAWDAMYYRMTMKCP